MADEYFDEISEISLPAKFLRRSVGIAFDVGKYINYTVYSYIAALKFCFKTCVAMKFVDDDDDDDYICNL